MSEARTYSVAEAVKAQSSLREAAELAPERFPIEAFVGMISDEIESLRKRGWSDGEIVRLIEQNSEIRISAEELAANYAEPSARGHHGE